MSQKRNLKFISKYTKIHNNSIENKTRMKGYQTFFFRTAKVIFLILLFASQEIFARSENDSSLQEHEITVYAVTSAGPIDWSNPSDLFKSMNKCYLNSFIRRNYSVIGHTVVKINSSLLPKPRYVGMTGAKQIEKMKVVLVDKIGFGSLGFNMSGKIEPESKIINGLELKPKCNKVAFIKFKINEEAVRRVLQFIDYYGTKTDYGFAPCDFYNGALYPRYKNEGAGCSAFVMTLLDISNVLPAVSKEWLVDINVPMELIGGEFNNNKRIKNNAILRTKNWHNGQGKENVDFVNYKVYDPSKMYEWIIKKRTENDKEFHAVVENEVYGLRIDRHDVTFNENDSLLKQRNDTSLFLKHYYKNVYGSIKK